MKTRIVITTSVLVAALLIAAVLLCDLVQARGTIITTRTHPKEEIIYVSGTMVDPNNPLTYDQIMAGYLSLPAPLKTIFKYQIGVLEDNSYIVYINPSGSKYHKYGCRYVNEKSRPVLLKSVEKQFQPCKVCYDDPNDNEQP